MKALSLLIFLATLAVGQTSRSNLRSIEGTVVEFGTGKPIMGAQVGLVNSNARAAARGGQAAPFVIVSTDASGQFKFSNVASDYYAWITPAGRPYYNEQFLTQYGSRGTLVTVTEGGNVAGIELDLIEPE